MPGQLLHQRVCPQAGTARQPSAQCVFQAPHVSRRGKTEATYGPGFVPQQGRAGSARGDRQQTRAHYNVGHDGCDYSPSGSEYAVLLECDGILVDAHNDGHRVAFNHAFKELGYDCFSWSVKTYHDLLRLGDGTGVGLIGSFLQQLGPHWVPPSEQRELAERVYDAKARHLRRLVQERQLPLRKGVAEFVQSLVFDGVSIGVITETNSHVDAGVVDAALDALGPGVAANVRLFSVATAAHGGLAAARGEGGQGGEQGVDLEELLAEAKAQAKARNAAMLAAATSTRDGAMFGVSSHLMAGRSARRGGQVGSGFVAAAAAMMDTPLAACAVLAASSGVMEAAKGAGAMAVAVPPSLSARGRYPAADVLYDGWGPGGGATWPRIKGLLSKRVRDA